jgi:hypothetical protein
LQPFHSSPPFLSSHAVDGTSPVLLCHHTPQSHSESFIPHLGHWQKSSESASPCPVLNPRHRPHPSAQVVDGGVQPLAQSSHRHTPQTHPKSPMTIAGLTHWHKSSTEAGSAPYPVLHLCQMPWPNRESVVVIRFGPSRLLHHHRSGSIPTPLSSHVSVHPESSIISCLGPSRVVRRRRMPRSHPESVVVTRPSSILVPPSHTSVPLRVLHHRHTPPSAIIITSTPQLYLHHVPPTYRLSSAPLLSCPFHVMPLSCHAPFMSCPFHVMILTLRKQFKMSGNFRE